jgi:hypothetical protein
VVRVAVKVFFWGDPQAKANRKRVAHCADRLDARRNRLGDRVKAEAVQAGARQREP